MIPGLCAALLLCGCGALQPQAPTTQANRVSAALAGITEACAEHRQQLELPSLGAPTPGPAQAAMMRTEELAHVVALNPRWIYQDQTLQAVAASTISYLRECGMGGVAEQLRKQTG